jgi:hypothetical protein
MDSDNRELPENPGEGFRKLLAQLLGRIPSEEESRAAFSRAKELLQIIDDVRNGRNGMRRDDVPVDNLKPVRTRRGAV